MVGAFITYWLFSSVNLNPLVSLVISGPVCFILGWIFYKTLFRRAS